MTLSGAVDLDVGLSNVIHNPSYDHATLGSGRSAPSPFASEFFTEGPALFIGVDTNDAMTLGMQDDTASLFDDLHCDPNSPGTGRLEGGSSFDFNAFSSSYQTVCNLCLGHGAVLFIGTPCPHIEHIYHVRQS